MYEFERTTPDEMIDPREVAAYMLRNYMTDLEEMVKKGQQLNPDLDFFFIVIHSFKQRIEQHKIHTKFVLQLNCPTPTNNQTVYRYNKHDDALEYLWTIPNRQACQDIYDHMFELDEELDEMKRFVIDYMHGELDKKAKRLNGEEDKVANAILTVGVE